MSKATILIVEDEAIIAKDLSQQLTRLGYEVLGITDSGEEAVILARERRPGVILMDIRLKGRMDGIKAAEAIGRDGNAPVIYLTAHSDRATLQRAKLTGPFGYILKPFEERELETQIEIALYKNELERKLRQKNAELQAFNNAMVDRELRMIELKKEVDALCAKHNEPLRYGYAPRN
jgi:DNA-binding NtrC family response regulator